MLRIYAIFTFLFTIVGFLQYPLVAQTPDRDSATGTKTIVVQKGETLSIIAKTHLSNPSRWKELLKYNNIPNPNLIKPGLQLAIPAFLRKEPIAYANLVVGRVDWKPGEGAQEWNPLSQNHELYQSDTVRTAQKSKADLSIQGTGLVRVHENSILQLNFAQNDVSTPSLYLRKGSLDSFISKIFVKGKMREGEKLHIKTPSALAAVRGTEFRVSLDSQESSTISCFDGLVLVSAENKTVEVAKGYATFVEKGKAPVDPYPIPDPPRVEKE